MSQSFLSGSGIKAEENDKQQAVACRREEEKEETSTWFISQIVSLLYTL